MTFQKGKSGNPSGRPKETLELAAAIRKDWKKLLKVLTDIAADTTASRKERILAVQELLDRGFGKSSQEISLDAETIAAISVRIFTKEPPK